MAEKLEAALHGNPVAQDIARRAGELDQRRQRQIEQQKESIDRMVAKLEAVGRIVYDDEQWDVRIHGSAMARTSLRELLK